MEFSSQQMVMTRDLTNALIAALKTVPAAALVGTANLHLFNNNVIPTPDTPLSAFVETAFSGYTVRALTITLGLNLPNNAQGGQSFAIEVAATASPFVPDTLQGYYVTDSTNAILYASEVFPDPIPMAAVGDYLDLFVVWGISCVCPSSTP